MAGGTCYDAAEPRSYASPLLLNSRAFGSHAKNRVGRYVVWGLRGEAYVASAERAGMTESRDEETRVRAGEAEEEWERN